MALGGGEGGWWPAAAPVRFYDTWEGRQSLGTSQLKKKSTRGGAHRRGWVAVLWYDSSMEKGPQSPRLVNRPWRRPRRV
jgi:hypothetical protein